MAQRDYYEILGVSKTASADELKSAYRKLARKYHPDATKNDPKMTERFKEVQEAYDVLGDATKRGNYDQFGHAGVGAGGAGGAGGQGAGGDPFEAFRRQQSRGNGARRWNGGPGVSVEDFDFGSGGGTDFSSLFENMFGGGRGGGAGGRQRGRGRAPQRGQDIEHPVTLTFDQAARGTHLQLQIDRGGKIETIDVKVPPGVKEGSRLRVKGRGEQTGGEPGDLSILVTQVGTHPYFRREELDIYVDVPVSLYEALLGAKVEVPTLDDKLAVTIPPGTPGGAKLRIKGKGIQRGDEQGDEYAVIKIVLPKNLDDADKELVAKLKTKHPIDARADVPWK
jgi:DnaJ-class molecular chaperone